MQIGKFRIDLVGTGPLMLDGGSMFGVAPKPLWEKSYGPTDETNRVELVANILLIRFDAKAVLVDCGSGTKLNEKLIRIYGIDREKAEPQNALAPFGIAPEDITDVVLTHLHFDHAGGATTYVNGELKPSFAKAKYYVQKQQLEWAMNPTDKDRASYFPENFMPVVQSGRLNIIEGELELFEGVRIHVFNGHTAGLQTVSVTDGKETVFYAGDLMPTSAHIPLPFNTAFDNNPVLSISEKRELLSRAVDEDWTIAFEHDAYTRACKVVRTERGFAKGVAVDME